MKRIVVTIIIALVVPTAAIAGPCTQDKEKFCKGVEATGACLAQHKAELSEACKAKQAKAEQQPPAKAEQQPPAKAEQQPPAKAEQQPPAESKQP